MTKTPENISSYGKHYSDNDLLDKIKNVAGKAGKEVIKYVLTLYYVLKSDNVPLRYKAEIIGALGYFILPVDLVPDFIPIAGYSDDLTALIWVYKRIKDSITPDIENKVNAKLRSLGF